MALRGHSSVKVITDKVCPGQHHAMTVWYPVYKQSVKKQLTWGNTDYMKTRTTRKVNHLGESRD